MDENVVLAEQEERARELEREGNVAVAKGLVLTAQRKFRQADAVRAAAGR